MSFSTVDTWRISDGGGSQVYYEDLDHNYYHGTSSDSSLYQGHDNLQSYNVNQGSMAPYYDVPSPCSGTSRGFISKSGTPRPLDETNGYSMENTTLDSHNSFEEPHQQIDGDFKIPVRPLHGVTWQKASFQSIPDKREECQSEYDTLTGGNTDDAFAEAEADLELAWKFGKCGSVLPSKANKCLRASERINERAKGGTTSSKTLRTSSSSKTSSKSHSKSGHGSHHKKKSSRN